MHLKFHTSMWLVSLVACSAALAEDPAFTDPEKAGPDFAIQGEYEGEAHADDGKQKFGAQIIALGDGKFHIVGYKGGLPGAGWKRGDETMKFDAEAQGGKLAFDAGGAKVTVEKGVLEIVADGNKVGELKKVERKSATLGKKPPLGALVLFDGTEGSLKNFENGKLVEGKYLAAADVTAKETFADHSLHIEFRTPFMPKSRGQGRGNSGVYVQARFEVQVLDSFGLEGANNECGGIYSVSEPAVNMCFPPLAWQTYDIDFTAAKYEKDKKVANARITVRHNDVMIHDNIEIPRGTPGSHEEGPAPDGLFLQNHGNPVVFQNIWVVVKK